jgi:four helix bundle protein
MNDEGTNRPDLLVRTKRYALQAINLYGGLSNKADAQVLGRQLLRSATSVGAHYREAQRAKSNADFISKIEGLLQELSESGYWLELLEEAQIVKTEQVAPLLDETSQLTAIFVTIVKKVKAK